MPKTHLPEHCNLNAIKSAIIFLSPPLGSESIFTGMTHPATWDEPLLQQRKIPHAGMIHCYRNGRSRTLGWAVAAETGNPTCWDEPLLQKQRIPQAGVGRCYGNGESHGLG